MRQERLYGKYKVDMMEERVLEINPKVNVTTYKEFYMPNNEAGIIDETVDYIVDAVDTVTAKLELVREAKEKKIPVISSMGTGNKLNPAQLEVTDISKTSICPLAKVMRKEVKKRNLGKLKVVYSKEEPIKINEDADASCKKNCICPASVKRTCAIRNQVPGSTSFVPPVAGMIIASEVIKDLCFRPN